MKKTYQQRLTDDPNAQIQSDIPSVFHSIDNMGNRVSTHPWAATSSPIRECFKDLQFQWLRRAWKEKTTLTRCPNSIRDSSRRDRRWAGPSSLCDLAGTALRRQHGYKLMKLTHSKWYKWDKGKRCGGSRYRAYRYLLSISRGWLRKIMSHHSVTQSDCKSRGDQVEPLLRRRQEKAHHWTVNQPCEDFGRPGASWRTSDLNAIPKKWPLNRGT